MKQTKKNRRPWRVRLFDGKRWHSKLSALHLILDSDNLLEDLHIPDSRLIDGDAAELALIGTFHLALKFVFYRQFRTDPNTFEELHKAAECLLNLQGVFYFGEEEHGTERTNPFATG